MDIILLLIYAFFVWLIFIKFKWLPWNITSQVIVVTIPIIALTILVLMLNIGAPSSARRAGDQLLGADRAARHRARDRSAGGAQPARSRRATCCFASTRCRSSSRSRPRRPTSSSCAPS